MTPISRRSALLLASAVILASPLAVAAAPIGATLYKNPQCPCCEGHADHLKKNRFLVDVVLTDDLLAMARQFGVPPRLDGCHISKWTVVIGHVPSGRNSKALAERPKIIGISIPGMPVGLPGMEGPRSAPIPIYELPSAPVVRDDARSRIFMMVT